MIEKQKSMYSHQKKKKRKDKNKPNLLKKEQEKFYFYKEAGHRITSLEESAEQPEAGTSSPEEKGKTLWTSEGDIQTQGTEKSSLKKT